MALQRRGRASFFHVTRTNRMRSVLQREGWINKSVCKSMETSAEISWTPRPWGGYEVIGSAKAFYESEHQIKKIYVNPGARLSLQSHQFRSELWCVVSGTAEATIGDQKRILRYGEHIFVPQGTVHRLANPEESSYLVVVEVQTGSAFDESDIIRHQDDYGR